MALSFVSNGVVIMGCKPFQTPADMTEDRQLVVVWFDGEADLYVIDGDEGMASLKRYYERDWDADRMTYQVFTLPCQGC